MADLQEEILKSESRRISEEVDWKIICYTLTEVGWIKIKTSWSCLSVEDAYNLKEWCAANIKGHYKARGNTWLFEREKDATMFILRWT